MQDGPIRIAISAGEVSGDQHVAKVVLALRQVASDIIVRGMGGKACRDAGVELVVDSYRHGATMGFSELLKPLFSILHSFKMMRALLRDWRPQVLVLVDYPDFNLRLAKYARSLGIRVVYFVPPKVWAWRAGRVKTIKNCVDRLATIFPFETSFYLTRGYTAVSYVGNPIVDAVGLSDAAPKEPHTVSMANSSQELRVVLLPGSRTFEIERILPTMLRVFEQLVNRPNSVPLRAEIVVAPNMNVTEVATTVKGIVSSATASRISWTQERAIDVMRRSDIGILKSGTCNVEAALVGLPFVCVYSGSRIARIFTSLLVTLTECSPVNIIRAHTVKELLQVNLDDTLLFPMVAELVDSQHERDALKIRLEEVRSALSGYDTEGLFAGTGSVGERVARIILDEVEKASGTSVFKELSHSEAESKIGAN